MDDLRNRLCHVSHISPGMEPRTCLQLIISPDPRDSCDLDTLRELATSFAHTYLPNQQIAIFYHDDNPLRIPHAHLVVNNADLTRPGKRISLDDRYFKVFEMGEGLQRIASELGLTPLTSKHDAHSKGPVQATYKRSRDLEMEARGASWKCDVRDRMACAMRVSSTEAAFVDACRALGLSVRPARSRRLAGEWVYEHPAAGGMEVAGSTLGLDWSRDGVNRRLSADAAHGVAKPEGKDREALLEALSSLGPADGEMALQVLGVAAGRQVRATDVLEMVSACAEHDVRSMADFVDAARETTDAAERDRLVSAAALARALGHLSATRDEAAGPRLSAWERGRARRPHEASCDITREARTWQRETCDVVRDEEVVRM